MYVENIINYLKNDDANKLKKIKNQYINKRLLEKSFDLEVINVNKTDNIEDIFIMLVKKYIKQINSFKFLNKVFSFFISNYSFFSLNLSKIGNYNSKFDLSSGFNNIKDEKKLLLIAILLLKSNYSQFNNVSVLDANPNFDFNFNFFDEDEALLLVGEKKIFTLFQKIKNIVFKEYIEFNQACNLFDELEQMDMLLKKKNDYIYNKKYSNKYLRFVPYFRRLQTNYSFITSIGIYIDLSYLKTTFYEFKVASYLLTIGDISQLHLRNINLTEEMFMLLKNCRFHYLTSLDISENRTLTKNVFDILSNFSLNFTFNFYCSNIGIRRTDLFRILELKLDRYIKYIACHLDNEPSFIIHPNNKTENKYILNDDVLINNSQFLITDFFKFYNLKKVECYVVSDFDVWLEYKDKSILFSRTKTIPELTLSKDKYNN
jgi:hypothetical protein